MLVRVPTAVLAGGVQAASSTRETFSGACCGDLRLRISSGLPQFAGILLDRAITMYLQGVF